MRTQAGGVWSGTQTILAISSSATPAVQQPASVVTRSCRGGMRYVSVFSFLFRAALADLCAVDFYDLATPAPRVAGPRALQPEIWRRLEAVLRARATPPHTRRVLSVRGESGQRPVVAVGQIYSFMFGLCGLLQHLCRTAAAGWRTTAVAGLLYSDGGDILFCGLLFEIELGEACFVGIGEGVFSFFAFGYKYMQTQLSRGSQRWVVANCIVLFV